MSRVLKGNSAPNVSVWGASDRSPPPAIDPERVAWQAEQQRLEGRLAQQAAELAGLRAQLRSAFEEGEAKGREAGVRETADGEARRLARLESGIEQALDTFRQAMDGLERLAPVLAHEALAGIFGSSDERLPLVVAAVRHRFAAIEAGAVLQVEVSAADFADDQALGALETALGPQGPAIHASVALKSGECRIKLRLGTLDIGLDQQWGRLSALLQDMAEPLGAPA